MPALLTSPIRVAIQHVQLQIRHIAITFELNGFDNDWLFAEFHNANLTGMLITGFTTGIS